MRRIHVRLIISLMLIFLASCDEPETVVTNIVHADGSVTRKIEMRNSKNQFQMADIQVPCDSTWAVRDSCEINAKGDTTWVRRAEKLFKTVDEINLSYQNDSGFNRKIMRKVDFSKKFRWFNTEYRYSESVGKLLPTGYPVGNFLNDEELKYFYSPDYLKNVNKNGPDSLKYRELSNRIDVKTETWTTKNLVNQWISEFHKLINAKGSTISIDSLKVREDKFTEMLKIFGGDFDSLWTAGVILKDFIGKDDAIRYKSEADSAIETVIGQFMVDFKEYSVRIVMPGELTGTNGFSDSSNVLLWPVKSDYFLADRYEMWAESKTPNRWAWIVSGLFLVFVITGLLIKQKKG
jgi:hypothetical protein